jgi:hypothetical protein
MPPVLKNRADLIIIDDFGWGPECEMEIEKLKRIYNN